MGRTGARMVDVVMLFRDGVSQILTQLRKIEQLVTRCVT